ncbi:hypothetical protein [Streptomyces sp. NPDC088254]|uniref:hypothetical protein n=1 Tax=Streptomyces sp. NPDC088254 TaxID=3365847 RepID=UPI003802912A
MGPLARAEALTALPALFGPFPRPPLVEDQPLDHVPSFLVNGFRESRSMADAAPNVCPSTTRSSPP